MSSFTNFDASCNVTYHHTASMILGKPTWVVLAPFRYYVGNPGSHIHIDVPAGFLTDGASVPRIFWSFIPPWGEYGQAVVLHDFLCERKQVTLNRNAKPITREYTDTILAEALKVVGVGRVKRWLMTNAVNAYRKLGGSNNIPKLAGVKTLAEHMIQDNINKGVGPELDRTQFDILKNEAKKAGVIV